MEPVVLLSAAFQQRAWDLDMITFPGERLSVGPTLAVYTSWLSIDPLDSTEATALFRVAINSSRGTRWTRAAVSTLRALVSILRTE